MGDLEISVRRGAGGDGRKGNISTHGLPQREAHGGPRRDVTQIPIPISWSPGPGSSDSSSVTAGEREQEEEEKNVATRRGSIRTSIVHLPMVIHPSRPGTPTPKPTSPPTPPTVPNHVLSKCCCGWMISKIANDAATAEHPPCCPISSSEISLLCLFDRSDQRALPGRRKLKHYLALPSKPPCGGEQQKSGESNFQGKTLLPATLDRRHIFLGHPQITSPTRDCSAGPRVTAHAPPLALFFSARNERLPLTPPSRPQTPSNSEMTASDLLWAPGERGGGGR